MIIDAATLNTPAISALKQEYGSLANALAEISGTTNTDLQPPTIAEQNITETNTEFTAALRVAETLRTADPEDGFTPLDNNLSGNTSFQAQLIAQSLESTPAATTPTATATEATNTTNLVEFQPIETPPTGTFNQLLANNAYQNIQAVAIPENVVIDPQKNVFSDEVKEIEEYAPSDATPGFGEPGKSFEAFAAVQNFLTSISSVEPTKISNPVEQTISSFAEAVGIEPQNTSTSLLV